MRIGYRHIVLIGMMGAGKTTVGRLLALRLDWAFWDNDEALSEATGRTAAELQLAHGQAALHEIEDRLLQDALRGQTQTVCAAAGSVVLDPGALRGALAIWLRTSAARQERNIASSGQQHRPLPPNAAAALQRMNAARLPLYARAADVTVDVAAVPATTCDRMIDAIAAITQSA